MITRSDAFKTLVLPCKHPSQHCQLVVTGINGPSGVRIHLSRPRDISSFPAHHVRHRHRCRDQIFALPSHYGLQSNQPTNYQICRCLPTAFKSAASVGWSETSSQVLAWYGQRCCCCCASVLYNNRYGSPGKKPSLFGSTFLREVYGAKSLHVAGTKMHKSRQGELRLRM